jgi:putative transposase
MGSPRSLAPAADLGSRGTGAPAHRAQARDQWDCLGQQNRLPVAHDPQGHGPLEHPLWLLSALAAGAGLWARLRETLRPWERQGQGRLPEPSAGCAESQRIKTATQGTEVGCDGHKQGKGRKRHILIDTLGLLLAVVVTAAHVDDRQGLGALLTRYVPPRGKRLRKIWGDKGYPAPWLREWVRSLKRTHKIDVEVVERTGKGFAVVKQRWKVERTLAGLLNDRRHRKDYERLTANREALIQISMVRLLLKRLA